MPTSRTNPAGPPRDGAARLLATALMTRFGDLTVGLPIILLVVAATGSYAWAGVTTGALALGAAVATPLLGRLADRVGHRRVLAAGGSLNAVVLAVIALSGPRLPAPALVLLGMLAGATSPPVEATVRAILTRTQRGERRQRLLTIDTTAQEIVFIVGPPVHVAVAQLWSPSAAVMVSAIMVLAGIWSMVSAPACRVPAGAADRDRDHRGPLTLPAVRRLAGVSACWGAFFGVVTIGVVARAEEIDAAWLAGPFNAVWSAGSLVAGVAVVLRPSPVAAAVRLRRLALAAALLALPLAPASVAPGLLMAALFAQGLTVAPAVSAHAETLAALVPVRVATEAFAWTSAATVVGVGVGDVLGGLLVDSAGAAAAMAAGALALGTAALLVRRVPVAHVVDRGTPWVAAMETPAPERVTASSASAW